MKKILLAFIFSSLNVFSFVPQNGDILFQDGSKSDFNDAIKNVTSSWKGKNFSHCGIIFIDSTNFINGTKNVPEIYVIEAISEGVKLTHFSDFLARNTDANNNPKVVVGRIIDSLRYTIPLAIENAQKMLGADYDFAFDFENDKYYCSELVYFSFLDRDGEYIFETNPMTFINQETNQVDKNWIEHFDKLGIEIPEGKEGINPGGLSKSKFITIIYSYY
jgi:uncharacterized protein YycO